MRRGVLPRARGEAAEREGLDERRAPVVHGESGGAELALPQDDVGEGGEEEGEVARTVDRGVVGEEPGDGGDGWEGEGVASERGWKPGYCISLVGEKALSVTSRTFGSWGFEDASAPVLQGGTCT